MSHNPRPDIVLALLSTFSEPDPMAAQRSYRDLCATHGQPAESEVASVHDILGVEVTLPPDLKSVENAMARLPKLHNDHTLAPLALHQALERAKTDLLHALAALNLKAG